MDAGQNSESTDLFR